MKRSGPAASARPPDGTGLTTPVIAAVRHAKTWALDVEAVEFGEWTMPDIGLYSLRHRSFAEIPHRGSGSIADDLVNEGTLHDPVRWKCQAVGRYHLTGERPPRHGAI